MSALGPPLQQSVQRLIVDASLLTTKSENEVVKARVTNPILDNVQEVVILRSGTAKILNTFESVGIKLQTKQGVESKFIFA